MKNPKYNPGDTIYLRESAVLGFIESYKIDNVSYDKSTSQWMYNVNVKHRGPAPSTTIDRVTLRNSECLLFRESELIEFCDAIQLAIDESENRLAKLKNIRDARCGEPE